MDKINYIKDLKSLIRVSKHQIVSVMGSFGFLPIHNCGQAVKFPSNDDCQHINEYFDLNNLICTLKEHLAKFEACSSVTSAPLLPTFHTDDKFTCIIDAQTKEKLLEPIRENKPVPAPAISADEYLANYSSVEKNILYQYTLTKTAKIQTPPELSIPEETEQRPTSDDREMTEEECHTRKLETLKRERDLKRRRIAYRKKVSTKNKSVTEVTREIISNLMEALFSEKVEDPSKEHSRSGSSSNVSGASDDRKSKLRDVDDGRNTLSWTRHSHSHHQREEAARHRDERKRSSFPCTSDSDFKDDRYSKEKLRPTEGTSTERNSFKTFLTFSKGKDGDRVRRSYEGVSVGDRERGRHRNSDNDVSRVGRDKGRDKEYKVRNSDKDKCKERDRVRREERKKDKVKGRDRGRDMDRNKDLKSKKRGIYSEDANVEHKRKKAEPYEPKNNRNVREKYGAKVGLDEKREDIGAASSEDETRRKQHKKKKRHSLEKS